MQSFLGLDVGTTSVSLVVLDLSTGITLFSESRPHGAHMACSETDVYVLDSDVVLSISKTMVNSALERFPGIEGIGVTGQMHGVVLLDESGGAISPTYTWLDMRAARCGSNGRSYLDELKKRTGMRLAPGCTAATLFALSEAGDIPRNARTFCTITDYVAMQLAGIRVPLLDPSQAHSMGMYDIDSNAFITDCWDSVTSLFLPHVVPSATIIGHYRNRIPITAAIGDNQASFLASVRNTDEGILVNIGTSGQICYLDSSGKPPQGQQLGIRPFPSGGRLMVGASLTGGKSFDVLTGLIEDLSVRIGTPVNPYSILDGFQHPPVVEDALRVETTFRGTRLEPERTGSISGINLDNLTFERLFWAFADGIVEELYQMIATDQEVIDRQDLQVVASGNAVEKNISLKLAIEKQFDTTVLEPLHRETAARGAVFMAIAGTQGGLTVLREITELLVEYRKKE